MSSTLIAPLDVDALEAAPERRSAGRMLGGTAVVLVAVGSVLGASALAMGLALIAGSPAPARESAPLHTQVTVGAATDPAIGLTGTTGPDWWLATTHAGACPVTASVTPSGRVVVAAVGTPTPECRAALALAR